MWIRKPRWRARGPRNSAVSRKSRSRFDGQKFPARLAVKLQDVIYGRRKGAQACLQMHHPLIGLRHIRR